MTSNSTAKFNYPVRDLMLVAANHAPMFRPVRDETLGERFTTDILFLTELPCFVNQDARRWQMIISKSTFVCSILKKLFIFPFKALIASLAFIFFFSQFSTAQIIDPDNYDWSTQPEKIAVDKQFANASAVVLKEDRILNFYYSEDKKQDLQSELTYHKIVQLNDTRGIETYNTLYIPLTGVTEVLDIKARTISPDGKVTNLDKSQIKEMDNKDGEGAYKMFAFEGLENGSRLEYLYKVKKDVEYSFRIRVQGIDPVQLQRVSIVSPENLKFDYKTYNGKSEYIDTIIGKRRFVTIASKDVPGKTEEKYSAYSAELMRHEIQLAYNSSVSESRILTYNTAVRRMYPLLYNQDPKNTKKIKKLSAQLKLSKYVSEEKIRQIENYIKTTIQEVKITAPDYANVGKILQSKIADPSGFLKLYIAFFEANNINCEVVYTTDRSKINFDPDFESWNYLDENLLYFPDFDKYLDPSDVSLRYPMIPPVYTLNSGLFMEEVKIGNFGTATSTVKKIPAPESSKNAEIIDAYCKFNPSLDSVDINLKRSFLGTLASGTRYVYNYSEKDDRKKLLDELMKFSMQDAKVIKSDIANYNFMDEDRPLEFSGEVEGTTLIERTGRDVLFKVGDIIGPQTELYEDKERQSQIDIFYAHHYSRNIQIEVPKGYKLAGAEALKMNVKFNYDGKEACGFISDYTLNNNLLSITVNEYYNTVQLPKERFEDFRKVINASADFNKINIVFEKI